MQTEAEPRRPPPRRWRPTLLDGVLIVLVLAAGAAIAGEVRTSLVYRWDWGVIAAFLVKVDPTTGRIVPNLLLEGLFTTLRLAVWGLLFAAAIGLVMGFARTSSRLLPRLVSGAFVLVVRNIPPLVFVFIVVFFIGSQVLPLIGIGAAMSKASPRTAWWLSLFFGPPRLIENFLAGLLCLALFTGAYVTEIVRAGIESVPQGQIEAGAALGLSPGQVMRLVVVPQALRNVWPPLANQFIQMIKDSSLVSLVSVQELSFVAQDIQVLTQRVFEVLLFTGGLYFVICGGLSLVFGALERRALAGRR